MRQVVETDVPVIVKRRGEEQAVIVSVRRYRELTTGDAAVPNWLELLTQTRMAVAADRQGRPLPDPAEVLRQVREERDAEIAAALGR